MSIHDTITQIARSGMPSSTEINLKTQIEYYQAFISWNLNDDPERPNKKSKTIILNVSYEVLEDILKLPEDKQRQAMNQIEAHLRDNLKSFDTSHDTPYCTPVPSVTWVIDSTIAGLAS
ncbi:hypothetical protein [Halomonas sp. GT]|uniref:hypothetical protein n=1 Tax=Halomonas sp. GT TaxID=1971364 RepID=UPI0009F48D55|nr:hypothetical protein [Halomonas sp. GT]